jgi:DNA-binding GntR family transcriptional regulator
MVGTAELQETAPEPKYWQLRTVLLRAIDTEFGTGQVIPNERELAARFGVARATLRQALDQLELEGRLVRRRGVGTVIAAPRVGVPVSPPEEGWPGAGGDSAWRVVGCTTAVPALRLTQALGVPPGESVHTVRRVRLMEGRVVGTEALHVPDSAVPHLTGLLGDEGRGRSVLRQLQRLALDGESRAVELGVAEDEEARLLERPPGIPVLVVTSRYAAQGRIAAVGVSTYRADTCRLTFGETGLVDVAPVEIRTAS